MAKLTDTVDGINESGWDAAVREPITSDERNKLTEAWELKRWAERPKDQLAYFVFPTNALPGGRRGIIRTGGTVTTWLGTVIGTVLTGHVYPHNFGGRIVSITVRGTNGAEYYGRASWDWGTCIRLYKRKGGETV